jgi:hypothetical protein
MIPYGHGLLHESAHAVFPIFFRVGADCDAEASPRIANTNPNSPAGVGDGKAINQLN